MTKRIAVQSVLGAAALAFVLQGCGSNNDPATRARPVPAARRAPPGRPGRPGRPAKPAPRARRGTTGSGGSFVSTPSCTGLTTAAAAEPTKGGACVAADPQLCYKTCGPEKAGVKSETCTGGVYAEMSGCSFDPAVNFACYKIPAAANTVCPAGDAPGVDRLHGRPLRGLQQHGRSAGRRLQRLGRRREGRLLRLPGGELGRQADLELRERHGVALPRRRWLLVA